ncbi:lantibiotic dehydratase [Flectobacillus roseus]|uniref:lantibiotic dehydratase n=1 Tax=Flectobacillus roseus TaxID=502259 RepID=UPI0024B650AE|nr:lantibiotic dehydratase [Flectobacillus roseus]MDI9871544.1 lantibiotic dehydratase [Flectobacillus roseus]
MTTNYQFLPQLIIRTPAFAFNDDFDENFLFQLLENPQFTEALYLASPVLFEEAKALKNQEKVDAKKKQKVLFSLSKYYTRMCSRCTPFGLFAGCAIAEWSDQTSIQFAESFHRHTRLDMHYAGALAQRLAEIPEIAQRILYYPNSSQYRLGEEFRYVEYRYVNGKRQHQISAIDYSPYIDFILQKAQSGATLLELASSLVEDEITLEQALDFVAELINAQLLVSELEPAITGDTFTQQLITILARINHNGDLEGILSILQKVEEALQNIDKQAYNAVESYAQIMELLQPLGIPFEEGKLFQTDRINQLEQTFIQKDIQEDICEAIELLYQAQTPSENGTLQQFIDQFYERYDAQEVPLLVALDTEAGIGYGITGKNQLTPIAEGLSAKGQVSSTKSWQMGDWEQYLFQQWLEAYRQKAFQIDLQEKDIAQLYSDKPPMAASIPVMFRLTGDNQYPLYLENIGGSSAVNIIGRFAHASEGIWSVAKEITTQEQAQNPEVILAEIVHLPENRVGNIILHPAFRPYEIPYLAKSSVESAYQLSLDDLMVSVDIMARKVILRSKRLQKEIVPRLSNAHNYIHNAVPVYRFLGDLQHQGQTNSVGINWQKVYPDASFYPRVCFKNMILEPATWQLQRKDFEKLLKQPENQEALDLFLEEWKLPQRFVLSDSDNELLVNTHNSLSIQTFLDTIKNRSEIILKEFLHHPEANIFQNNQQKGFTNQVVAFLVKKEKHYSSKPTVAKPLESTQRSFALGSEWLYYKIYCGIQSAEVILSEAITPVLTYLKDANLIDNWFFIRYADPEKHIRLRFHLKDVNTIALVLTTINQALLVFKENNRISKILVDTYERELERYGANIIEETEQWFGADSDMVLGFINATSKENRDDLRWIFACKALDILLNDFDCTTQAKYALMESMRDSFAREFNLDKPMKLLLDAKFRENRKVLEQFLVLELEDEHEYAPLLSLIQARSMNSTSIVKVIVEKQDIAYRSKYLSDLIHMTINRIFPDGQRTHELLIYDFMSRYYKSLMARSKQ